ncbi:MAG: sulfotransferase [Novosphingobium sp.]|uniref:tetratricopeptide repeat-containing sulfotransferase family protein n=1 Tax=Novosphingobium sp. TaxID=1874826 RepID=UPI003016E9CE
MADGETLAAIALDRRARIAIAARDGKAAAAATAELTTRHPDFAPGWLTASTFLLTSGRAAQALDAIDAGLAIAPGNPALRLHQARVLHALGQIAEARHVLFDVRPSCAPYPLLQHELGNILILVDEHACALDVMLDAGAALDGDPRYLFNLAVLRRFLGDLEEAEALLDRVIVLRPGDWEAIGLRSQLRRQTLARNHVPDLRRRLAEPLRDVTAEVQLRYALAKELEDLGAWEESFAELSRGAKLRRGQFDYVVSRDIDRIGQIIATFDAQWLERRMMPAPPCGARPVFVMGLPRSGTTLVERIISSHSQVVSLGELNDFPVAVERLRQTADAATMGFVAAAAKADLASIAAFYRDRTRPLAGRATAFVDKLPLNYLYAGLIAATLPEAHLVLLRREPSAAGYAMFKTLFNQGYPFSYDLHELGCYVAAFEALSDHWERVLGDRLAVVRYERLVTQPEAETRRLIAHCALDWDAACLRPHENAAASSTHSAAQVREPIHDRSVELWQNYQLFLTPFFNGLLYGSTKDTFE